MRCSVCSATRTSAANGARRRTGSAQTSISRRRRRSCGISSMASSVLAPSRPSPDITGEKYRMKIFITGGAGFIGSTLADRLVKRGERVAVIDNYDTGRRDNLARHPNLIVIEGSITDGPRVRAAIGDFKPDLVVHAAASYKDPNNWEGDALTNTAGTAIVAQAAKAAGASRLVYFQTALCYGLKPLEQPITL